MGSWVRSPSAGLVVRLLVSARHDQGLTQRDLAARIGKSPAYVAKIELGERRVDVVEFLAITRAIGLDDREAYAAISTAIEGQPAI